MSGTFASLHLRALSHATEDLEKVKTAMRNVTGDAELVISNTEGHYGNPIVILEAAIKDGGAIDGLFARLSEEDVRTLADSLDRRIDDVCNVFLKLDKQAAFAGELRLGGGDDVISVRAKVRAFPARREVACVNVGEYLRRVLGTDRKEP